jgi:hypothetical protein
MMFVPDRGRGDGPDAWLASVVVGVGTGCDFGHAGTQSFSVLELLRWWQGSLL